MKLKEAKFNSVVVGAEKEMSFSIESENSIIFDILRNKMYSDKVAAICREISSNGRDANREAGKNKKPIEITINEPNEYLHISDMSISFRDFGNGISPTKMEDIFLKYGASTKRETNTQTGGFGLGAKTPFAYSDTFSVITICEVEGIKTKYSYNAMIDSTRKGKMILFDTEETDEEVGTQIIIPINENDRNEFERKCVFATIMWDVQPIYRNFAVSIPEVIIDSKYEEEKLDIVSFKNDYDSILKSLKGLNLLIDGIPYVLDKTQFKSISSTHPIFEFNSFLKFKNGELTIAANREAVQYDQDTISRIKKRFSFIQQIIIKMIDEYFNREVSVAGWIRDYQEYKSILKSPWSESTHPITKRIGTIMSKLVQGHVGYESDDELIVKINEGWSGLQKKFGRKLNEHFSYFKFHKLARDNRYSAGVRISEGKDNLILSKLLLDEQKSYKFYLLDNKSKLKTEISKTILINCEKENKIPIIIRYVEFDKEFKGLSRSHNLEKAIKEGFELYHLFEVNYEFYKDIKPLSKKEMNLILFGDGASLNEKSKVLEDVEIIGRVLDSDIEDNIKFDYYHLKYQREYGMVTLERSVENICFYNYDRMSDLKNLPQEIVFYVKVLERYGIKTVFVNNRDWKKYFSSFNYPTLHEYTNLHLKEINQSITNSIAVNFYNIISYSQSYNITRLMDKDERLLPVEISSIKKELLNNYKKLGNNATAVSRNCIMFLLQHLNEKNFPKLSQLNRFYLNKIEEFKEVIEKWANSNEIIALSLICSSYSVDYHEFLNSLDKISDSFKGRQNRISIKRRNKIESFKINKKSRK